MKEKPLWEMSEDELRMGLLGRLVEIREIGVHLEPNGRIGKECFEIVRSNLDALELACARAKMYMNAIEKL